MVWMMDENVSQVNCSNHLWDEELIPRLKLTFNPFIFPKTFLFKVIVQAIFSFNEFLIYLSRKRVHHHLVKSYEFWYIFLLQPLDNLEGYFSHKKLLLETFLLPLLK